MMKPLVTLFAKAADDRLPFGAKQAGDQADVHSCNRKFVTFGIGNLMCCGAGYRR